MDSLVAQNYTQELYFLIAKFLESGPCQKTLEVLKTELSENKIIPKRLDWIGEEHEQTFEELESKYPHIARDHLLKICLRIGPILDKEIKPYAPGVRTLLGAGRQSLLRTLKDVEKTHLHLREYILRRHGTSIFSPVTCQHHNIVQVLFGRETSGPCTRRHLVDQKLYNRIHLINRTLGHLSAVYCVLFDRTGKYVITGSDDLLVKVWSSIDGRLLSTLRGAAAEITDIAINLENTLLAVGSLDKIIRVWCLQTSFPVATLSAHTGMITGVNFCPISIRDVHYLVSTSTDGSVAFWSFTIDRNNPCEPLVQFQPTPVLYHEKLRPGQAQMICSSFSPGGMFLATGSADHHVRVYCMSGPTPHRVMELEKHSDRVDSIEWAKQSLKLVSGSKDGTAIIWQYRAQNWHTRLLDMNTTLPGTKAKDQDNKLKLRVTMVCWSADDKLVITSVNNNLIKVWSASTGKLCRELNHHRDVVYVLESHPSDPTVLLSAGHDGLVYLWNLMNGEQLFVFQNHIEGQGNGAIFDAKWAPDGTLVAATDAHGHLLLFGLAVCSEKIRMLPKELFFHTDYRPMIRDASNAVLDEQTQIPPHLMPPPFLVDVDGNPYPPQLQRLVPGRENCTSDQLIPNIIFTPGGGTEIMSDMRSNIDQRIHELAHHNHFSLSSLASPSARARWRRSGDVEGVRQSSGDWQREGLSWKQGRLILPLSQGQLNVQFHRIKFLGDLELEEYEREKMRVCEAVPVMSAPLPAAGPGRRLAHTYRTRATRGATIQNREDEAAYESAPSGGDSSNSAEMESSSSQSSSSEYSDWVADQGVNLEPPQRSRRTRKKRSAVNQSAAAAAATTSQSAAAASPESPPLIVPVASTSKAIQPAPFVASNRKLPPQIDPNGELPVLYRPSEWLSEVIPKKFPYYPQMGDEVMFFAQGYAHYVKAVQDKKLYPLAKSQLKPWGNLSLREPELVKVIGIKYELRPPRLCCLRLAVMSTSGRLTADRFTLKYHDIADVIDFFVLQQTYDTAVDRNWKIGDRFRSMIDSEWWWGVIEGRRPDADSPFLCHRIRWDNGEMEDMSPWDMEPVDPEREPEKGGSMPVLPDEFAAILYHPRGDEWPGGDRDSACRASISGLEEVMGLSIAEPFSAPVDITVYKTYPYIVEFSIDLTTIKARFENRFYRRLTAAQFDIRYLATNAEKFNESHSIIVKHARIVTDLCLRICKEETYVDVQSVYRNLLESYVSSCSETETTPSTSKRERAAANRSLRAMRRANHHKKPDWRRDCQQLLDVLWNCRDSEHFRGPVDRLEHPDYDKVIDTPMDLGLVREELQGGNYSTPLEFCKDVRMIFSNSRSYNTNKRSKVYVMTVRLAAMAEEHMKRIIKDWKSSSRKQNKPRPVNGLRRATPRKSKPSSEEEDDDEDSDTSEKLPTTSYFTKGKYNTRTRTSDKARDVSTNEDSNSTSATTTTNSRSSSTAGSSKNLQPIRLKIKSQLYKANSNHNNNSNKFIDINQPSTSSGHNLRVSKEISYVEDRNDTSPGSSSSPPSPSSSSSTTSSSSLSKKNNMAKNVSTNGFIKVLRPIRKQLCFDDYAKDSEDEDDDEDTVALTKRVRTVNARRNGETVNVVENVKKVTNRFESSSDSDHSDTEEEIKEDKNDLDYVVKEKPPSRSVNGHGGRRGQKRSRRTTSSDEYSDEPEYRPRRIPGRAVRPRRKTKRPSNYDESNDEEEEYVRRGSEVSEGRKPGVGSRGRRKEYREASSGEEEEESSGAARPCISISSRGRVRKIRARARAFLKE